MVDYSTFSMYELCNRFAIYDEERESIEQHVHSLSAEEQEAFFSFKRRNAVGLGLEPSPFEGIKAADIFRMDKNKFIIYDRYDFEHYKHYIDELLKSYSGKPDRIMFFVNDELIKNQRKLDQLQEEGTELYKKEDLDENYNSRLEVEKYINYINEIKARNEESIIKVVEATNADVFIQKPQQIVLALYYFYLQEAGYEKYFEAHPQGKVKAIQEIANKLGIGWKNFQLKYNDICRKQYRVRPDNQENIKNVLPFLSAFPLALEIARRELKETYF